MPTQDSKAEREPKTPAQAQQTPAAVAGQPPLNTEPADDPTRAVRDQKTGEPQPRTTQVPKEQPKHTLAQLADLVVTAPKVAKRELDERLGSAGEPKSREAAIIHTNLETARRALERSEYRIAAEQIKVAALWEDPAPRKPSE